MPLPVLSACETVGAASVLPHRGKPLPALVTQHPEIIAIDDPDLPKPRRIAFEQLVCCRESAAAHETVEVRRA